MEDTATAIDRLRASVAEAGRPELLPLDLSYDSLDRLEDYLRLVLEERVPADREAVLDQAVAYVRATHTKQVPEPTKAVLDPDEPVRGFKPTYVGTIRDYVERFDVPLQRRILGELVQDIDGTLATLRADVEAVNGVDRGAFDGSATSLIALGRALKAAVERDDVTRDQLRRLSRGGVVYLGWALQQRAGGAAWSGWAVQDDARDLRFAWWKVDGWYPEIILNDTDNDEGWLEKGVEYQVMKRKKAQ